MEITVHRGTGAKSVHFALSKKKHRRKIIRWSSVNQFIISTRKQKLTSAKNIYCQYACNIGIEEYHNDRKN
ncbi:Translation initiation factor [Trichinella spiralis]|uniref:Translation initiation factor n=1 Tax=Trichinella spiralis TaxID=6334 RepID=A0ABR3L065_TRISP